MREAVRGILDAEVQAKQLVQEAEEQAEKMLTRARQEASVRMEQCARAARIEAEALIAVEKEKTKNQRREMLQFEQERIQKNLQISEEARRHAVEESVRVIFRIP